ncbi:MAG: beta-lactamase family protein [Firmicutes bacterium]|nr:beta-lactamase family protein [Bacillota bacterium]
MNFDLLTRYLDSMDEEYGVKGLEVIVSKDHEVVYRHQAGYSDYDLKVPVDGSEYYYFYSCTKVVTMTAMMQLIEAGKASLYDPISKYLPEWEYVSVVNDGRFAEDPAMNPTLREPSHFAKNQIRVIDCMAMMAGLTYDTKNEAIQNLLKEKPNATTREVIAALAKVPLIYEPGTRFRYSLGHDVVAALIEVISGERYGEYLKKHIFEPLGITTLTCRPTEEEKKRLAAMYTYDYEKNRIVPIPVTYGFDLSPEYESGGATLCGSAYGYFTVIDALANGGVGANGNRILKEETVMLFTHSVTTDAALDDFHKLGRLEYGYGLGVRVKINSFMGCAPAGEFGWDGAAGGYCSINPFDHIAIVYVQHVMNFGEVYRAVHPRVRDLVYECLEKN